ncbi:OsmC family protein [Flavobacterium sp. SM2513]|uniref:OsmC family protein n=1 Tax=Flavobacterium sp. SM2513 TaxID=3424766 RepID=UPI003D7FDDC0
MSTKTINVLGYANGEDQFVVKANNLNVRISKNNNDKTLEGPSPLEYVLAGYAGCINAVGKLVAKEQGINLKSVQVEISANLSLDKYQGVDSNERAGFQKINAVVKPTSEAAIEVLEEWIKEVEKRCPIHDNLINPTPLTLQLLPQYETAELA